MRQIKVSFKGNQLSFVLELFHATKLNYSRCRLAGISLLILSLSHLFESKNMLTITEGQLAASGIRTQGICILLLLIPIS
jgi:hypothetical protein